MKPPYLSRIVATLALSALASWGCGGASFEDQSKIKGLRVLAVQKEPAYPAPGETVKLRLLYWDGKSTEDNPRNIQVLFAPPCFNPRGDLYYNCFEQLIPGTDGGAPPAADAGTLEPNGRALPLPFEAPLSEDGASPHTNHIKEFSFTIRPDIISARPPRPNVHPYGLAYVLFTACAGTVGPVPAAGPNTLPLGCFDEAGNRLGSDDFVLGYTAMYVYNDRRNANPVIDDFLFEGVSIKDSTTADPSTVRHVPRCTAKDRASCPKHRVQVQVDPSHAELEADPTAVGLNGERLHEQMWVTLYSTQGDYKSSVRLLNDATKGWNHDNATEFTAPAEPGPVRLFGVVHDNRGGMSWTEGLIIVD